MHSIKLGSCLCLIVALAGCGKPDDSKRLKAPVETTMGFTGSMRPMYQGGESILILPAKIEDVRIGDVVAVWWSVREINVSHQVIGIRNVNGKIGLVTKGIANKFPDPHIIEERDFIGIIVKK
jgi:signal peptidase I